MDITLRYGRSCSLLLDIYSCIYYNALLLLTDVNTVHLGLGFSKHLPPTNSTFDCSTTNSLLNTTYKRAMRRDDCLSINYAALSFLSATLGWLVKIKVNSFRGDINSGRLDSGR